jgi:hypothetical protein
MPGILLNCALTVAPTQVPTCSQHAPFAGSLCTYVPAKRHSLVRCSGLLAYSRFKMQVVFRHGARTPLTPNFWEGTKWDVCGPAFKLAPLHVTDHNTGEPQLECIDGKELVHYEGGCTRGELTRLGQVQARPPALFLCSAPPHQSPFSQQQGARASDHINASSKHSGIVPGMFPLQSLYMLQGSSLELRGAAWLRKYDCTHENTFVHLHYCNL